jgi:WD40 repeat protein
MFDAKRSEALRLDGHGGYTLHLVYSPDGETIASGDVNGVVKIWRVDTGSEQHSWRPHPTDAATTAIRALGFSPDSTLLATVGDDKQLAVWDAETAEKLTRIDLKPERPNELVFLQENRMLAMRDHAKVKFWDWQTGVSTTSDVTYHGYPRFSKNGRFIAIGTADERIAVWDLVANRRMVKFTEHGIRTPRCGISNDGRLVAARDYRGSDRPLLVWDAHRGRRIRSLNERRYYIDELVFSPNNRYLLVAGRMGEVKLRGGLVSSVFTLWDLESGDPVPIVHSEDAGDGCYAADFSPDGRYFATGDKAGPLHVWKMPD